MHHILVSEIRLQTLFIDMLYCRLTSFQLALAVKLVKNCNALPLTRNLVSTITNCQTDQGQLTPLQLATCFKTLVLMSVPAWNHSLYR